MTVTAAPLEAVGVRTAQPARARLADLAREVGVPPWKVRTVREQSRAWSPDAIAAADRVTRATGASGGSGSGITPTARRSLGPLSASSKSGPGKIDAVCPSPPTPSRQRSSGQCRSCINASAERPAAL